MKLMFYINTISHGGAERVIVNLATDLSERGHDCLLVTSFKTPKFEYQYGDKVCRISMTEKRIDSTIKRNLQYISTLHRLVRMHKPDVLISFMPEANNRALIATIGTRTKTIISVRSDPNNEYRGRLYRFLAKYLYRKCDGIVFQTEEAKQWFPKAIQRKGEIILNQVDEIFFSTKYEGVRQGIVATGRLTAPKNHRMLIDAYTCIKDSVDDKLMIYGDGPLLSELHEQIENNGVKENVMLKGNTNDVPSALKAAKVYVLSSNFEGLPNALMEAMALGLPCISTDCPCGGPRMLFGEELKEWLVPVGDESIMAEKILKLLGDEGLRIKVGELCRRRAELFKPDVIINEWENYIMKISANNVERINENIAYY